MRAQPARAMSSVPSTSEIRLLGALTVLRDGSRVRLRQVRGSDKELFRSAFERLSDESRYRRFLGPMPELSESLLRYLVEVDHHDHEAIVAIDEETGEAVGDARYVRDIGRPDVAELAVTVIDDWQGRGLGSLLLEVIGARAREEGIPTFTALVLASNQEIVDLFEREGTVRVVDRESGTIELEMPIPAVGLSLAIRKLLRVAARGDVAVSPPSRAAAARRADE